MIISFVVAFDTKRGIGKNNDLPWHMPNDFKRFKSLTLHKSIIMGKGTYDSMGKALPKRRNIVVSRNEELHLNDSEVVHSIQEGIELCAGEEEIFIIGGAKIFSLALPLVDKMYITQIDYVFECDRFFPSFNLSNWSLVKEEKHQADENNPHSYVFLDFERKSTLAK